jgi:DNA polymerase-1
LGGGKLIAIDTETVSLENRTLVGFSVAKKGEAKYYPIAHNKFPNVDETTARSYLQRLIDRNEVVFHNSSFDVPVLTNWGINFDKAVINDTLIIANLLDENVRHGLKALSKRYLHYTMTELKEIVGTGKKRISVADADPRILEYATDDARQTLRLFNFLYARLLQDRKLYKLYIDIERPLLMVIANMHLNGITIDAGRIKEIEKLCTDKTEKAKEKLEYVMEGVNCNSTKQLREFFIEKERMPILKTTDKGAPSMDKETLKTYAETNSAAKLLLEYRKYAKILSTFIPALSPKDIDLKTRKGKIHTSFNQAGTTSGRFSSSKPNMQNIPKGEKDEFGIRDCIVADEGHILIGADYSQVELRIMAHFSQDFNLMKAYNGTTDIHTITAEACGITRDKAKTINFGLIYGMRAKTLGKRIDVGYDEAQSYIDKYFETYNAIKPFWELTERNIRSRGYVETFFGRKRHRTCEFQAKDKFEQSREIGSMTNAIIQGTGADMMKKAMVAMYPRLQEFGARIISTVHDEVIVSCPIEYARCCFDIVKSSMLQAGKDLTVPIGVDCKYGRTWGEAHGDGYDLMKFMAERKENSKKQARRH